ncbi:MAG: hypothetical protein ABIQ70_13215 [Dokdonella sp.]
MNRESLISATKQVVSGSQWLFGPLALLFLAVAGWRARSVIATVFKQADTWMLLVVIGLWASLHLLTPALSRIMLMESGADVSYRALLEIHVGRLPARYLPGGIWHTVSRVIDLRARGVSRAQLSIMVLLENSVPLAVAVALGGLCLCLSDSAGWLTLAAALGGSALLACPWLLLRHRSLAQGTSFRIRSYLRLIALTTLFWLGAATAFYCFWSAFPQARGGASALQIYGTYLLAWSAGFVSVFAPQGIGVFESVAALFLRGTLAFAGAAVLIAGFRVAILAADMLAFGFLFAIRRVRSAQRRSR